MGNSLGIAETAQALGVSKQTLRKRDEEGRLKPTEITLGGHRRYNLSKIQTPRFHPIGQPPRKTVAYAGVSSTDQKHDLDRRVQLLELYFAPRFSHMTNESALTTSRSAVTL